MLIQPKKWIILNRLHKDILDQVLANRGVKSKSEIEKFLNPDYYSQLYNPFLLSGVKEAIARLAQAIINNEKVGIFSDYDADGVTSAVLLKEALGKIGIEPLLYIPSRTEGYGLNQKGVDWFVKQNIKLFFALDLGSTQKDEFSYASKKGLDSIIIDHHIIQKEKLPDTIVINPKQKNDHYPFKELSACGLVYKFVNAIYTKYPKKIHKNDLKLWLELVAISTVADIMPILDENRVLVKYGLLILERTKRAGLNYLIDLAKINKKHMLPWNISFQIAPRLNSPGRIGSATLSYQLLTTADEGEAKKIATEIESVNSNRRQELEEVFEQAKSEIELKKLHQNKIILLANKKWKTGLVGLVAGRLMERYYRPVIVLNKGEKFSQGSARSIEAIHILETLTHAKRRLEKFGGHARAAGLTLETKHLDEVYSMLLEYLDVKYSNEDLTPKLTIDCEITSDEVNFNLLEKLKILEPFGYKNPRPLFCLQKLEIQKITKVGADKSHIKITFNDGLQGIFFDGSQHSFQPVSDDKIDIVCYLQENNFNNNKNIDLVINDWKKYK